MSGRCPGPRRGQGPRAPKGSYRGKPPNPLGKACGGDNSPPRPPGSALRLRRFGGRRPAGEWHVVVSKGKKVDLRFRWDEGRIRGRFGRHRPSFGEVGGSFSLLAKRYRGRYGTGGRFGNGCAFWSGRTVARAQCGCARLRPPAVADLCFSCAETEVPAEGMFKRGSDAKARRCVVEGKGMRAVGKSSGFGMASRRVGG